MALHALPVLLALGLLLLLQLRPLLGTVVGWPGQRLVTVLSAGVLAVVQLLDPTSTGVL